MTDTATTSPEQTNPVEALAEHPQTAALVKMGISEVMKGKISLADLFQRVAERPAPEVPDKKPPVPQKLSAEVLDAIKRLPDVFGKTVVTADRALTKEEAKAIVEERSVIDKVMTALKKRKEESIREVLANHADHVLEKGLSEKAVKTIRKDAKGHYAPWDTQDIPVEGTDLKIQRFSTGGKPNLTIEHIEMLHAEGKIDRKTYLKITKKPDLPRVLDETGMHEAIQKDPKLFFLLASRAEPTLPSTTVKVVKNS